MPQPATNPALDIMEGFPPLIRDKMMQIRQLIQDIATEDPEMGPIEESLKWGQPSWRAKGGSTFRMGWSPAKPQQFALYFHCQSSLVETFKTLYPKQFVYEGKRAIILEEKGELDLSAIKVCVRLTLRYHRVKHLPLLGAQLKTT